MGTPGPKQIKRYNDAFKLKAVLLSHQDGVLIKDVADSLNVHPFMLSRWRKQVRDGEIRGERPPLEVAAVAELQRLREVEKQYKRLREEHEILKKAIRFAAEQRRKSSPSSQQTGKRTRSK